MGFLKQDGEEGRVALGSRCLLGRRPGCDLRLDNTKISGEHASLSWAGDRWELKDLGSLNGTFVGGQRLRAGDRVPIGPGAVFTLAGQYSFRLEDASPPVPSARHRKTGLLRTAVDGLLVLPEDETPEVTIFEDQSGQWVAEEGDTTRVVADGDIVIADGEGWVLDLAGSTGPTVETSVMAMPPLETMALRFAVNRDEEHIEVTVTHGDRTTTLPARTYHYLLLTLARATLADADASPAERGWVDRELLCRMLRTDPRRLNVDVFRVRRQLTELGIQGGAGIIARRPGTGQLRLGTPRVEVTKL